MYKVKKCMEEMKKQFFDAFQQSSKVLQTGVLENWLMNILQTNGIRCKKLAIIISGRKKT